MRIPVAGLVLALAATHAAPAHAAPDDAAIDARLAFVEAVLAREEGKLRTWRESWISTFSALALLQLGLGGATTDPAVRGTALIGGTKTVLAVASILAVPSTAIKASSTLRALGARTPRERRARLAAAERLLEASASEARFRRSWIPLVAGAFLNLGGATVMWAGYHRPGAGWFGLGSGVVVGQLFYQTQPTGAISAWAAYTRALQQGKPLPSVSLVVKEPAIRWSLAPSAGGLVVQGTF
ncbi:MAG: hypothetical protein ABJE95_20875 [Byssovorax sp.]